MLFRVYAQELTFSRSIMPMMILDGPSSFMDAAGEFLLVITSRGTLTVWYVLRRHAPGIKLRS